MRIDSFTPHVNGDEGGGPSPHFLASCAGSPPRLWSILPFRGKQDQGGDVVTRRRFIQLATIGGSGVYLTTKFSSYLFTQVPGGTLRPDAIPKFVSPLLIPPAMPRALPLQGTTTTPSRF